MAVQAHTTNQINEATHQRRAARPVSQDPVLLTHLADLPTLQRVVAVPCRAKPTDILALQRIVGNRAVTRLIQAKPAAPVRKAVRKVQVHVTSEKDGTALIAPYSHARHLNLATIYQVPSYKMTVTGSKTGGEQLFKVIRFGLRRRGADPLPVPAQLTCNAGLTSGRTFMPSWNKSYSPRSFTGTARRGAWVLVGHILIHEGPAAGEVAGSLGCIEVTGTGEWNRFLGTIESFAGATCARVGQKGALTVKLGGAPRPVAVLRSS